MHAAYIIVALTPILISMLGFIGLVCFLVGEARAQYRWDYVDRECDDADVVQYYMTMLTAPVLPVLPVQPRVPSLEELADMAQDMADMYDAREEFDNWVDAMEVDKEYLEREERRLCTKLGWPAPQFCTV